MIVIIVSLPININMNYIKCLHTAYKIEELKINTKQIIFKYRCYFFNGDEGQHK